MIDVDQLDRESAPQAPSSGSAKLQRAKRISEETETELSELCRSVNEKISSLGIEINRASEYRGVEWALHILGAAGLDWASRKANVLRRDRLEDINTEEAVQEIGEMVLAAIAHLGESEDLYELDQREYESSLNMILGKQAETTPKYLTALAEREKLEAQVTAMETEVREATMAERPGKEKAFEALKRKLDTARLAEVTYLAVIKNAQDAIPNLQQSRDAATQSIQSLHGMRQAMLEKFADFKVILERATTAMQARANVELYETIDPAFNKAITAITANNVATAGAALEVWTQRIREAAIDPKRSQALLQELLTHISDAAASLKATEEVVASGPRAPLVVLKDQDGKNIFDSLNEELEPVSAHQKKKSFERTFSETPSGLPLGK